MPCLPQPCLDWYSSSWGQCSEVCGGGEQQRLVTCPEEDRCDEDHLPSNIQACNSQPCAQWVTGSWGQVRDTYCTHTHTHTHKHSIQGLCVCEGCTIVPSFTVMLHCIVYLLTCTHTVKQ
uniref:Uncharacterized protein n=1 Tax=Hucho hucho TaxID=62062 RepID=A0A4W5LRM4_9TELE